LASSRSRKHECLGQGVAVDGDRHLLDRGRQGLEHRSIVHVFVPIAQAANPCCSTIFPNFEGGDKVPERPIRRAIVKLRSARIEDVPVAELSGLALVTAGGGPAELLAIGDRESRLARAVLTDEPLEWSTVDLGRDGGQFEGVDVAGEGTVLVLCEDPPAVLVLDPAGDGAQRVTLVAGDRGVVRDVFDEASSSGEGLLPLRDGRLLVAKEKDPPLLVEFGPDGAEPRGIAVGAFPAAGEPERRGEPDGKPEGLVTAGGTFIVGLDTASPHENLCWYRP
jgi:hypothetical protein